MSNKNFAMLLLSSFLLVPYTFAANYPLGTMTCDDIGAAASEFQGWRMSKVAREEADKRLEAREFKDPVEKKNLTVVLGLVYGSYGSNWTVEVAGKVMKQDCEQGRSR